MPGAERRAGQGKQYQPHKDTQPQKRQALYTQDLWGNVVSQRRLSEMQPGSQKDQSPQPNVPFAPMQPPEHIIEGTVVSSSQGNTQHLRERLQQRGVSSLSNAELLLLVLRTHPGQESIEPRIHDLVATYSVQELLHVDFGVLQEQYKLGEAKAAQLQATLEVARRLLIPAQEAHHTVRSPADAAALVRPEMEFLDHEEMRVLLLDTKNHVVGNLLLYQGTLNSSVLRTAEVFRPAVTRQCASLIVCHNHPSGDPAPSPEDIAVTEQLVEAGKLLEIELVDHLIIGKNSRFVSLKERLLW